MTTDNSFFEVSPAEQNEFQRYIAANPAQHRLNICISEQRADYVLRSEDQSLTDTNNQLKANSQPNFSTIKLEFATPLNSVSRSNSTQA